MLVNMVKVYNCKTKKVEEHTLDECKLLEDLGILPKNYTCMAISNIFFEGDDTEIIGNKK